MSASKRLIAGLVVVSALLIIFVATTLYQISEIKFLSSRVVELRSPTVLASSRLFGDINASMASLRGWILTGDDTYRNARAMVWVDIESKASEIDTFSNNWTEPENLVKWGEFKATLAEFRDAQTSVEAIVNTPDAFPAIKLLVEEAVPLADTLFEDISLLIRQEENQEASSVRRELLVTMADIRGSLAMSLANVRVFLLTGDNQFRQQFDTYWAENQSAFNKLRENRDLMTEEQTITYESMAKHRNDFIALPERMFAIRTTEQWHMAEYLLVTEAVPRAEKLLRILSGEVAGGSQGGMVGSQSLLLLIDAADTDARIINLEALQWLFLVVGLVVIVFVALFTVRHRQRLLSESESRVSSIMESAADAVVSVDEGYNITLFNQAAVEVFGHSRDEVLGKHLSMLLPVTYGDEEDSYIDLLERESEGSSEMNERREFTCRRKSGDEFPATGSVSRVSVDNKVIRTLIMRDSTEEKRLSDSIQRYQRMEVIAKLTGGVAHDFNNLLTVIYGNLELLDGLEPLPGEAYELVAAIRRSAERGARLTGQLLAYSRQQPLNPELVLLNNLIPRIVDILNRSFGETIDIRADLTREPTPVQIDTGQLGTALFNLAFNSRDAMPQGGKLTIETLPVELDEEFAASNEEVTAGSYIMLSISDTGEGMTEQTIEKAFEPFFTTKPVGQGSGLGLSMVYGFTKQSRGHISIVSDVDQGTTIKMYFPRVSHDQEGSDASVDEKPEPRRGTETILLVEDDLQVCELAKTALLSFGYTVLVAHDGPEAMKLFEDEQHIDLLFTDINLPGAISGRQIAEKLTAIKPNLKVLLTTGYSDKASIHGGRIDGGVCLINKPYQTLELAEKLRLVLDRESGD